MSSDLICGYCNKTYSSLSNLNKHQRTSKQCLALRSDINTIDIVEYDCPHCEYSSLVKQHLTRHLTTCKIKIEKDKNQVETDKIELLLLKQKMALIEEQRDEYKEQRDAYKKQAEKPRINLTINNKQKFYQQYLSPIGKPLETLSAEITKRFNVGHLSRGQEGCAELVSEIINEDEMTYAAGDKNGDVFWFVDEDGTARTDDRGRMLIGASKHSLEKSAESEYENEMTTTQNNQKNKLMLDDIRNISTNNVKFRKALGNSSFLSHQTIKLNTDNPKNVNKGFPLLERSKNTEKISYGCLLCEIMFDNSVSRDRHQESHKIFDTNVIESKINIELKRLADSEYRVFDNVKCIVNFLTNFLSVDKTLAYLYDKDYDYFHCIINKDGKPTKITENEPESLIRFKRLLEERIKYRDENTYKYIRNLDNDLFRSTLANKLIDIEKRQSTLF